MRGGYAWNAFTRYIDSEVKFVMYWLVDGTNHTRIVQLFGMGAPTIQTNHMWGAGGRSLYWKGGYSPDSEVCPANPWRRYDAWKNYGLADYEGTANVPTNDVAAGYVACNYRPGQQGWKVSYPSTFGLVLHQGVGSPIRTYREDDDGDGQEGPAAGYMNSLAPNGTSNVNDGISGQREDALMTGGLLQQLALKWANQYGFVDYNVKWWLARATHWTPDELEQNPLGDNLYELQACSAWETPLVDHDGGGTLTPAGKVLGERGRCRDANYPWWPENSQWAPKGVTNEIFREQFTSGLGSIDDGE